MSTATPEVLWAQRSSNSDAAKNFIYLTISVPDVPASDMKLDLKSSSLAFTGHSDTLKKTYHLDLEFYAEVDPEESKINHTAKNVEIKLRKKELDEAYWPRLLKDSKKVHFLKTDFDKWVDEDEQVEAADLDDSGFGGMGGMPGMGGNDFGGIDFSKLGGGAGMPGMPGMGGMGGMGGDDDDEGSDDDDMPALEGEDEDSAAAKPAEGEAKPSA